MKKIIISGCNGRMGRVVSEICSLGPEVEVVAGFDMNAVKNSTYPVYADPMEFSGRANCIIDFSNPAALENLLSYCKKTKIPIVIATTGHSQQQLELIKAAAEDIPIFRSANMSLGINVLLELVKKAAKILGGSYDIEIIERHHKTKVDAPSGTAIMLADAAASQLDFQADYVYERQSRRASRDKKEIGISSVRGGTIVGEHEIIFAGRDEVIEIKHSAMSREIFANGAVKAALFLSSCTKPGLYDMSNLVSEE